MKFSSSGFVIYETFLLCLEVCFGQSIVETTAEPDPEILKTQFVDYGKTATLFCRSNDAHHVFFFWLLPTSNDTIIGPGNEYDDYKYDYEILTGKLIIRQVSTDEEGLYYCVSRGVNKDNINIRSVRMIVRKSWEEVDAHDSGLNYFRGVVVVGSLLIVGGAGYAFYKLFRLKKRHRSQRLLDASSDEEDSNEEIFRAPGTSKQTGNIVIDNIEDEETDLSKISIDFEDILKNSNNK